MAEWKAPHSADYWMHDRRPILSAQLVAAEEGELPFMADDPNNPTRFERFERPGEMAMIPYLRVHYRDRQIEAPLRNWAFVTFGEYVEQ